jgi:hypothetical protein
MENLKGREHFEDLGVDGAIISEWVLVWEGVDWMYLAQDRDQWPGFCGHGNEPSVSIKGGKFLNWLSDCQLLMKICAS